MLSMSATTLVKDGAWKLAYGSVRATTKDH